MLVPQQSRSQGTPAPTHTSSEMEQQGPLAAFPAAPQDGEAEHPCPTPGMLCPSAGARTPQQDFTRPFAGHIPALSPIAGLFLSRSQKWFGGSRAEDGGLGQRPVPSPPALLKSFAQCWEAGTRCGVPTVTGVSSDTALGPALAPFSAEPGNSSRVGYD